MIVKTEKQVVEIVVDAIIDIVHGEFPSNYSSRMNIYHTVGENLIALARILKDQPKEDKVRHEQKKQSRKQATPKTGTISEESSPTSIEGTN